MPSGNMSKAQVATACGEIILFTILGYYALKFIVNVLDPTNKQKADARNLVSINKLIYLYQNECTHLFAMFYQSYTASINHVAMLISLAFFAAVIAFMVPPHIMCFLSVCIYNS